MRERHIALLNDCIMWLGEGRRQVWGIEAGGGRQQRIESGRVRRREGANWVRPLRTAIRPRSSHTCRIPCSLAFLDLVTSLFTQTAVRFKNKRNGGRTGHG